MKSLEEFNIELKRAEDYLNAMVRAKKANKEDCENVKMHLDNTNRIVRNLSIPVVVERLKKLQKWYPFAGCAYDTPSIDWEKDSDGDWISVEDIEQLIKELESNAL